jgi:hypothetical protein
MVGFKNPKLGTIRFQRTKIPKWFGKTKKLERKS